MFVELIFLLSPLCAWTTQYLYPQSHLTCPEIVFESFEGFSEGVCQTEERARDFQEQRPDTLWQEKNQICWRLARSGRRNRPADRKDPSFAIQRMEEFTHFHHFIPGLLEAWIKAPTAGAEKNATSKRHIRGGTDKGLWMRSETSQRFLVWGTKQPKMTISVFLGTWFLPPPHLCSLYFFFPL